MPKSQFSFADLVAAGALTIGDGYRAKLEELGSGGPLFLRAGALQETGFIWDGLESFTSTAPVSGKVGKPHDVVITTKGNSVGRVGWVPQSAPSFVYSPHLSYWRTTTSDGVHSRFLYFWSRGSEFAEQLRRVAHGTDMAPYLSLRDQLRLRITLPSFRDQEAIAEVLGALDDKIAVNMEALVAADDLVRARFATLRGGGIPLGHFADQVRVQVDPATVVGSQMYVGLEHVPRRLAWLIEHGRADSVSSSKSQFRRGDILFGKLRPYFHKVVCAPATGVASTDILVVRAKEPRLSGFVLACASSDQAVRAATAASEGTRMPRTKWADLAALEFPWPGDGEIEGFSAEIEQISSLAGAMICENERLANARDELLPLLMSGRLAVRVAEKVAEDLT